MRRLPATTVYYAGEAWQAIAWTGALTVFAVYLVRDVGLDPLQLVLVGTAMELSILVFEVPTGLVADTYGRRLSLVVGWTVMGLSTVLVGAVPAFWAALAGEVAFGIGDTFTSGAKEAWIVDEVGVERAGRVFARGQQLAYAGGLAGIALAVALGSVDLGLALVCAGAFAAAWGPIAAAVMPETGFRRRPAADRSPAVRELAAVAAHGSRYVRAQPLLMLMLAIALVVGAAKESFGRLWEAHLIRDVGLPAIGSLDPVVWFGIFGAGSLVLGLVASEVLVRRFRQLDGERIARVLLVFTAAQAVALGLFAVAGGVALAVAAFWLVRLAASVTSPLTLTWLNRNVADSSVRATVISMWSQAGSLGEVAGGPALGGIGKAFGVRTALGLAGALLLPALWLYGRALRHGGREPELDALPVEA
jgi:MFS transporter, DHA3 family, tetracycline resistance protein